MKIIDISWPISEVMTPYKNKQQVCMEMIKSMEQDGVRESVIRMSMHTGTHVDAPAHFLRDGKTLDQLELYTFFGPCVVVDCTGVGEAITPEHFAKVTINEGDIVLLKTSNSALPDTDSFNSTFIYLGVSGASYLAEKKVKAVGIDYLSIEQSKEKHATHHELFNKNIGIIEGLRLAEVDAGRYTLVCLPLNIVGAEAAPARAVLIAE